MGSEMCIRDSNTPTQPRTRRATRTGPGARTHANPNEEKATRWAPAEWHTPKNGGAYHTSKRTQKEKRENNHPQPTPKPSNQPTAKTRHEKERTHAPNHPSERPPPTGTDTRTENPQANTRQKKTRSERTHRKSECRPHRRTPIHKLKIAKNPETSIEPRSNLRDS